jgi:CBS domain-containing protein
MLERKVGSTLVLDEGGQALGIFTRDDLIGRVVLPQVPLDMPIAHLMSTPVHSLDADHSALDAALLMAQHGVRHVPVTEHGRVAGVVSERDLFALQRLSLTHVSQAIRRAEDLGALQHAAVDIRRFAERLLGQGIAARQLTELISQLNDLLTARLVALVAKARGCDLGKACWLAFGSEGRGEQTLATDQDNGLIFTGAETERSVWLGFAREVNEGLDACGYPLCRGNVMASNPQCCLTAAEWRERFEAWMQRGAPQDLLQASIFFDLRALAGRLDLAAPLHAFITDASAKPPRFIKQLALNAMQRRPPLNWRGALETREVEGRACIDVKLQGTAIFVDAARIYALALGVPAVGTRQRLEGIAQALQLDATETGAWIGGFEFLQSLRLGLQIGARGAAPATAEAANLLAVDTLNDIDRRMLREALRMAQRLQQRLEMDYDR